MHPKNRLSGISIGLPFLFDNSSCPIFFVLSKLQQNLLAGIDFVSPVGPKLKSSIS